MSEKREQVAIRLEESQLDQADALAKKLSQPGLAVTRTDVLRMAIAAGLKAMQQRRRAA